MIYPMSFDYCLLTSRSHDQGTHLVLDPLVSASESTDTNIALGIVRSMTFIDGNQYARMYEVSCHSRSRALRTMLHNTMYWYDRLANDPGCSGITERPKSNTVDPCSRT